MKNSCKVLGGYLKPDPYTAKQVHFLYGGAIEVEIDHVVALSDAWQKGAAKWAAAKRVHFANDPLNPLAVAAGANRAKGDGTPQPGSRRTSPSDARTWPARSPSRPATACGSPRPNETPWPAS